MALNKKNESPQKRAPSSIAEKQNLMPPWSREGEDNIEVLFDMERWKKRGSSRQKTKGGQRKARCKNQEKNFGKKDGISSEKVCWNIANARPVVSGLSKREEKQAAIQLRELTEKRTKGVRLKQIGKRWKPAP